MHQKVCDVDLAASWVCAVETDNSFSVHESVSSTVVSDERACKVYVV
jgi:hypothetical protein